MTPTEVRLEREKLALEREMLTLERERLSAEREQWHSESEWRGQVTNGLHVGVGILGLAVAVALLLGGIAGYNAGLDTGRSQIPLPRTVRVSSQFLRMLSRTVYAPVRRPPAPPPNFDYFALYKRPRDARAAGNLAIVR
jgi:hypothetical protein